MLTVEARLNLMSKSGLMDTGPVFSIFGASTSNNLHRIFIIRPPAYLRLILP
jgi:hypothetical protein